MSDSSATIRTPIAAVASTPSATFTKERCVRTAGQRKSRIEA